MRLNHGLMSNNIRLTASGRKQSRSIDGSISNNEGGGDQLAKLLGLLGVTLLKLCVPGEDEIDFVLAQDYLKGKAAQAPA